MRLSAKQEGYSRPSWPSGRRFSRSQVGKEYEEEQQNFVSTLKHFSEHNYRRMTDFDYQGHWHTACKGLKGASGYALYYTNQFGLLTNIYVGYGRRKRRRPSWSQSGQCSKAVHENKDKTENVKDDQNN